MGNDLRTIHLRRARVYDGRLVRKLFALIALAGCSEREVDHVALGDATFASVCARCHGQDGHGGVVAPGQAAPRDLTDPAWQSALGDGQIEAIVRTGRGTMPAFQKALSADQIQGVVGKVRRLKRGQTP
jgi:mono/diheme cytochrome c family protein